MPEEPTQQQANFMAAMAGKFNPWMIPMMWMMGGGALSFGGMSIAIEKEEHAPEECENAEECEECEECPDIPPRRQELVAQVEMLEAANDALLAQLTNLTTTCAR